MSDASGRAPPGDAFKRFEREGWGEVAHAYDASFGRLTEQAVGPMLDAAGVTRGTNVLDVACGTGGSAAVAAARGATVVGVDLTPAMVELARRRCPEGRFEVADAEALPFGDAAFDAVVSGFGILHFADPQRGLSEMARVLRPGGRLALTAWCPPERSPYLCLVMGAVRELGRTETDLPAGPPPYQMGEPERICAALSAAGLGGCETRELDVWVEAESADGVLAPLMEGGVRTRKLLLAQASAALKRIEAAVAERAEAFRHGDVIRIARPALLAVATQPR